MTTPPVPPYGSPDEPPDPYAAPRPHQPPLTPYNPPSDDAPPAPHGGFAAPGSADPYGTPPDQGGAASPYGPAATSYGGATPYGAAPLPPAGQNPYGGPAPAYPAPGQPGPGYPGGYPSPGYPAPGYAPAYGSAYTPPPRTSGIAVASMIVSIASLVVCLGFPGIVGLVLGIVGLNQVMRDGMRGRGFAITGIVVGAVATAFAMLFVIGVTLSDA